jgi:hypothetical protein
MISGNASVPAIYRYALATITNLPESGSDSGE